MADGADRKDADLVVDVRSGEIDSFALLFERWFVPALTAAEDILTARADAARVAADTFQAVWLHLDDLADPEGFGAWVLLTSRTFARQYLVERVPGAITPSEPLFQDVDQLRRAVAKVLVRRQVPALCGAPAPSGPVYELAVASSSGPVAASGGTADRLPSPPPDPALSTPAPAMVPADVGIDLAPVRVHRYAWSGGESTLSLGERIRSVRLSPGTLFAVAIVLVGSLIWLVSRGDASGAEVERRVPAFAPAGPQASVDGAAARSNAVTPGVAPGGGIGPAASVTPEPATTGPTTTLPATSGRKVKTVAVLPRSGVTTTSGGRARTPVPVTVTTIVPRAVASPTEAAAATTQAPATDRTTRSTVATTTSTTARTTTTAGDSTTSTTARTTTSTTGRTTTTADGTTTSTTARTTTSTTGRTTTSTTGRTTTTADGSTTTTARPTTSTTARPTTTTTARPTTTTTARTTTTADSPASTRPTITTTSAVVSRLIAVLPSVARRLTARRRDGGRRILAKARPDGNACRALGLRRL